MINNCEMFICKQTNVGNTDSKAEIITLEKCYGIQGFIFFLTGLALSSNIFYLEFQHFIYLYKNTV